MRVFTLLKDICLKLGLIADYVVETGTSDIWNYRKWASGTAECWGNAYKSALALSKTSGYGYYYDTLYLNLPAGLFKSVGYANAASVGSTGLVTPSMYNLTTASVGMRVWGSTNFTWTGYIHVHARGRWK